VAVALQDDHPLQPGEHGGQRVEPLAQVGRASVAAQQQHGQVQVGVAAQADAEGLDGLVVGDLGGRVAADDPPDRRQPPQAGHHEPAEAGDLAQVDGDRPVRVTGVQGRPGPPQGLAPQRLVDGHRRLVQHHRPERRRRGQGALQGHHRP
jgi:hypothetical protein